MLHHFIIDTLMTFTESDNIQLFLNFINGSHANIKFTIEYATDTLNIEMKFNHFSFDSWVYRKPSHTNLMLNFNAICPETWKRSLILCLLNIAKHICSNDELFNLEINKLRDMFKLNGYPNYYFNKILNKFLNPTINDNINTSVEDNFIIIKIPFIGDY